MSKVLIVGCGDLGAAIASRLSHHEVIGLRRSKQALPPPMQTLQADVTQPNTLFELEDLNPAIVIYCVAADAQTDESYQAQYVAGLRNILATQHQNTHLQHVFFVSSTRLYGQNTQAILDESTPAIPSDFGGERLLEAESLLKDMRLNSNQWKSTSMRLSGIYGKGRLSLVNSAKEITKWPKQNHWSNRIHRDDAAGFIVFLVEQALKKQTLEDCYIVTDDMPTQQYTVLTWLANEQKVDTSSIQLPTMQGGKRLSNKRLRDTGFQLQYPNFQEGYRSILQDLKQHA
jgi:nucleoside-diphosphate-sugar epimerase